MLCLSFFHTLFNCYFTGNRNPFSFRFFEVKYFIKINDKYKTIFIFVSFSMRETKKKTNKNFFSFSNLFGMHQNVFCTPADERREKKQITRLDKNVFLSSLLFFAYNFHDRLHVSVLNAAPCIPFIGMALFLLRKLQDPNRESFSFLFISQLMPINAKISVTHTERDSDHVRSHFIY